MKDLSDRKVCARLCLLRAEGDGVDPFLVLQTEKGKWCPLNHGTAVGPPQYLLGAPEGVSRLLLNHRRILGGETGPALPSPALRAIFASSLEPSQVGGLVGLFLRLKSDGHEKVHLLGPKGIKQPLLFASQNIVRWRYPYVLVTEYKEQWSESSGAVMIDPLVYSDSLIEVLVTCGHDKEDCSCLRDQGDQEAEAPALPDVSKFVAIQSECPICEKGESGLSASSSSSSSSDAVKAILGHCIKLKKIEKLVVMLESMTSSDAAVLLKSPFWQALKSREKDVLIVLHKCQAGVSQSESYQKLVASLPSASHVDMHSSAHMEFGFTGSMRTLLKLHEIDGKMFPLPVLESRRIEPEQSNLLSSKGILTSFCLYDDGTCGLEDVPEDDLNANFGNGDGGAPGGDGTLNPDLKEPSSLPVSKCGGNRSVAAQLRESIAKGGAARDVEISEAPKAKRQRGMNGTVRVLFLGTGCAEPSKYRGGTGILVEFPSGAILLDAGESVWGQMVRYFGKRRALQKLSSISCVWVSHKHADHMLGLVSLLHHRASADRLLLVGPYVVHKWLQSCGPGLQSKYLFRHHSRFMSDPHVWQRYMKPLGITGFDSIPVYHCRDAYAAVLTHEDRWKISFSGDTRPCKAFIEASRGSTILIHEATFETKYHGHAERKKHCTISEALEISKQVQAEMTVLTHFSQRYPYVPPELRERMARHENIPVIAFDGLCIESSRLVEYAALMPKISAILESTGDEGKP